MGDGQVTALKEALCSQYIIIRKLYNELEEERDSSATAASEALSMILRLEREKAAEKMEACQYRRMAEEKMYHVEQSLEILEEVMQQKEMEIASLKYQLQACKSKLLSFGVDIPDVGEMRNYENPSPCLDKRSFPGFVRRNVSFPSLRRDQLCREIGIVDEGDHLAGQTIRRKIGDYTNQLIKKCEGREMPILFEESVKHVENLNKEVKESVQGKNARDKVESESSTTSNELQSSSASNDADNLEDESRSCSWYSTMSSNSIFEVPEIYTGNNRGESYKQVLEEYILGTKNMTEICDFMPQDAIEYLFRDENWLNKSLELSKQRKGPSVHHGGKLSTPKKGSNNLDYHWTLVDPSQAGVEKLKRWLQKIEDERFVKPEDSETGKDQLKLLRGIHEQLNTIETHLKKSMPKKFPPQDESSLVSIMEAVLSFSI